MKTVFADTGYWFALLNPRDELHEKAMIVSQSLGLVRIVTTEMVLGELLNFLAEKGDTFRHAAAQLVMRLQADKGIEIVPQSAAQFQEALDEYARRSDQTWSLTDCASFQVMRSRGMADALAHDKHFVQAGFMAMLRD